MSWLNIYLECSLNDNAVAASLFQYFVCFKTRIRFNSVVMESILCYNYVPKYNSKCHDIVLFFWWRPSYNRTVQLLFHEFDIAPIIVEPTHVIASAKFNWKKNILLFGRTLRINQYSKQNSFIFVFDWTAGGSVFSNEMNFPFFFLAVGIIKQTLKLFEQSFIQMNHQKLVERSKFSFATYISKRKTIFMLL